MKNKMPWRSRITAVKRNKINTYGFDQREIMRSFTYEEMVYLLIFGKRPSRREARLLRAVILSHCSHGITGQSTLAVWMAADCRSPFVNAALAGFLVGAGRFHQGGLEAAMGDLQAALTHSGGTDGFVQEKLRKREPVFGYGHRFFSRDPRARLLMELCKEYHFVGPYVKAAMRIDALLYRAKGIRMNIDAAGGAVLLEIGFPPEIASLIIFVGRGPMFAAAYLERLRTSHKPFHKIQVFDLESKK